MRAYSKVLAAARPSNPVGPQKNWELVDGKARRVCFLQHFWLIVNESTQTASELEQSSPAAQSAATFETQAGEKVGAPVLRLLAQSVSFEIYDPNLVLRTSESLKDFSLNLNGSLVYQGSAVVRSLVNAGSAMICEVSLDEASWTHPSLMPHLGVGDVLVKGFHKFLRDWERYYVIADEYKIVIADLHTYLTELRLWLERVELTIKARTSQEREAKLVAVAGELRGQVTDSMSSMFERFELIARELREDQQPVHRAFGRRHLHSQLLCAPFIHRTFVKPLGYAGDYEMMNMIVRNGLEGTTLYAKLVNAYLLDQIGPQAVRNRVGYLEERILSEASRMARQGKPIDIFCIACGPAWEARNFLAKSPLADNARFHLLDFNEETLSYAGARMEEVRRQHNRRTTVTYARNSVQNLLRGRSKVKAGGSYDLIYCSGLYDYLNDRIVRALNSYLYDELRPGGLMVVGNFAPCTPVINFIEHFLDWFLIYRDARQFGSLAPEQARPDQCSVFSEPTGANIFLDVRKPA